MTKTFLFTVILLLFSQTVSARILYITRHEQAGGVIKELQEKNITADIGIRQAKSLANHLVNELKFKGDVYASPFYRTTATAVYTAKLLNKKVILDPGLQEVARSKKISPPGLTLKLMEKYFPGMTTPGKRYADGWRICNENDKKRIIRYEKTLDAILAETKGDVLLVTHGAGTNGLLSVLNKRRVDRKVAPMSGTSWNCALFIYELNGRNEVISTRYETGFMKEEDITSNFRCPKIERPDDPRYMTREQDRANRAKQREAARKAKQE